MRICAAAAFEGGEVCEPTGAHTPPPPPPPSRPPRFQRARAVLVPWFRCRPSPEHPRSNSVGLQVSTAGFFSQFFGKEVSLQKLCSPCATHRSPSWFITIAFSIAATVATALLRLCSVLVTAS